VALPANANSRCRGARDTFSTCSRPTTLSLSLSLSNSRLLLEPRIGQSDNVARTLAMSRRVCRSGQSSEYTKEQSPRMWRLKRRRSSPEGMRDVWPRQHSCYVVFGKPKRAPSAVRRCHHHVGEYCSSSLNARRSLHSPAQAGKHQDYLPRKARSTFSRVRAPRLRP
jgi:hypothetical protein